MKSTPLYDFIYLLERAEKLLLKSLIKKDGKPLVNNFLNFA